MELSLNRREEIQELTSQWRGERFEDGRPKVSDQLLEKIRKMTLEEVWLPLYVMGYQFQFEGELKRLHAKEKMVGRAVTCTFVPTRPDLFQATKAYGSKRGWTGTCNQWVVDSLTESDVVVADMYDKIYNGTFVGGNLTTAIKSRTGNGGAVIWGGVRDIEQMKKIEGIQVCYRGVDPTPIRECVMAGFNGVTRIGNAVCLPGDVVFSTESGVLFIPSHMVEIVVNEANKSHAKDIFGFEMLKQGIYTTAQIDSTIWSMEMLDKMEVFLNQYQQNKEYQGLDWSLEKSAALGKPDAVAEIMKRCLE
ncbi:RraA family protein [Schaedlerella arabinosiphila]|uniref:RraA family protein n=1 Tax=Schaedlerella arabinosiphila TaxID=2044587 RepID=A0A9X5CA22_9FIRM|nr:hypothetical protein [Schaedlerella arabinosiphila]KAI4444406.1 hypothetical protein C824_000839 [Schaedlerella arabinosiphila]NDO70860.1 RraA family protein [Schaedlerella arabinosiphila]